MNGWTPSITDKLLQWQSQSRLHSLGHGRSYEFFLRRNNIVQVCTILLGAIAVFINGTALVVKENNLSYVLPLIVSALLLTAISTICNGILQVTKPIEIASSHEEMARGYNKIILQIDAMLSKEYVNREDGNVFLSKIENELIGLKTGGAKIPVEIWSKLKNEYMTSNNFQKIKDDFGFGNTVGIISSADIKSEHIVDVDNVEGAGHEPEHHDEVQMDDLNMAKSEVRLGDGTNEALKRRRDQLLLDMYTSRIN